MSTVAKSTERTSGFTPTQIPGCGLWLDGGDPNGNGSVTNAASISTWVDKSGNGRNGTNAGTAGIAYRNILNGRAVLRMSSSRYTVNYASFPNTAYTIFSVQFLSTNGTAYASMIMGGGASTGKFFIGVGSSGTNILTVSGTSAGWNDLNEGSPSSSNFNSWRIVTMVVSGSALNPYVDGNTQTAKTGTTGSLIATIDIGSSYAGDQNWTGDSAEILMYDSALTTNQRRQIEGYLARKWGLSGNLPTIHPHKTIQPFSRPFVPTDIDKCVLWLDAADPSTMSLTGSTITQWRDKSGNGNTTSGGTFNSRGTLGNNLSTMTIANTSFITANSIGISGASPQALVVVANVISDNTNYLLVVQRVSGSSGGSVALAMRRDVVYTDVFQLANGASISVTPQTKTKIAIVTHTGSLWSIFESGTAGSAVANTLNQQVGGGLYVSISTASAEIGEILVFNNALTTSDRQQLEGYLAKKWKLTANLPSNNAYKLYPPLTPVFTPLAFSSTVVWYDVADTSTITYASGSSVNVTGLKDKSPSAANLTRVTYTTGFEMTTANKMNGLPTLMCPNDPVDNNVARTYLTSTTSVPLSASVNYIFYVTRFNPNVLEGTSTQRGWGILFPFSWFVNYGVQGGWKRVGGSWFLTYDAAYIGTAAANTTAVSTRGNGPVTGTPFLCMMGKTAQSQYVFSVNGVYETKAGQNYVHVGGQPIHLGVFNQGQEICEMVVMSGTLLGRAEIQRIEGYLAWKWGLQASLPTTHNHYKARP